MYITCIRWKRKDPKSVTGLSTTHNREKKPYSPIKERQNPPICGDQPLILIIAKENSYIFAQGD